MKPLNSDNQGCDPISSNCVIWQGPDLDCIGLCKGDSVSQVVAKLAAELCTVMEALNITSYDISCFEIGNCGPADFQALIQLMITKICALEGIHDAEATGTSGGTSNAGGAEITNPIQARILAGDNIPDAVVLAPETFWYKNNQGDEIKEFQIVDLAYTAATKINTITGQIKTIDAVLLNHEGRIETLEEAPEPTLDLPTVVPVCVLPADPVSLDEMAVALENQFCELRTATGLPEDIYNAMVLQILGLNQAKQLQNGASLMSALPDWRDDVTSLSDTVANMWLTVGDMRSAIQSLQSVVQITDCDQLNIDVTGTLTSPNTLVLYFNGTIPSGYQESDGTTLITITDAADSSMNLPVSITANLNDPTGYSVILTGTPINGSSDLTITVPLSYTDGASVCAKVVTDVVIATGNCPILSLVPTEETIGWSFSYLAGAASLAIKLFAADGVTLLQTQVNVTVGPAGFSGAFTGLNSGVQYKVRLDITPDGAPTATQCPFSGVVTLANLCLPVDTLTGTLIIT